MKKSKKPKRFLKHSKEFQICMMRTSEGGERDNQGERIFEKIMAKNFSNFQKDINQHTEVAKWITKRIMQIAPPRHIIFKLSKAKSKWKYLKQQERRNALYSKDPG